MDIVHNKKTVPLSCVWSSQAYRFKLNEFIMKYGTLQQLRCKFSTTQWLTCIITNWFVFGCCFLFSKTVFQVHCQLLTGLWYQGEYHFHLAGCESWAQSTSHVLPLLTCRQRRQHTEGLNPTHLYSLSHWDICLQQILCKLHSRFFLRRKCWYCLTLTLLSDIILRLYKGIVTFLTLFSKTLIS